MNFAIIKSGKTKLLEVIKLRDWNSWEWNDFAVVREVETDDIKWFETEKEGIEFMLEHFNKFIINPKYFTEFDRTFNFYIK